MHVREKTTTHKHTLTHTYWHTHTLSLSLTHTYSHTHTRTHTHTLWLTDTFYLKMSSKSVKVDNSFAKRCPAPEQYNRVRILWWPGLGEAPSIQPIHHQPPEQVHENFSLQTGLLHVLKTLMEKPVCILNRHRIKHWWKSLYALYTDIKHWLKSLYALWTDIK